MLLSDLLQVLRDEFAHAADDLDACLMAWISEGPAAAEREAPRMVQGLDRLAMTTRLVSMEGVAVALEQLRDTTSALALLDEDTMGQGLGWLSSWRLAFEPLFEHPGGQEVADGLLAWAAQGPMAPAPELLAEWRTLLVTPPALSPEQADLVGPLPPATDADVSLALPEDIQQDLFETFLAEAPAQVERLTEAIAELVRAGLSEGRLNEVQRVAHTFKGSGNIIGIAGIGRLAHRIEDLVEFAGRQGGRLPAPMGHDLELAATTLAQMVYALRGDEEAPTQAREQLQSLLDWVQAIADGSWESQVAARLAAGKFAAPLAEPCRSSRAESLEPAPAGEASGGAAAVAAPEATPAAETEAQLRVGVGRLDRMLRGAGQSLVRSAQQQEQWRRVDERLSQLTQTNRALHQRLAELQRELERQGVTLHEKALAEGETFDPLEMDRYNHVQTLSRFVAELASDEDELLRGLRDDSSRGGAGQREQQLLLRGQHADLLGARLVPFKHIVARLRRTVTQTAGLLGRSVRLEVQGEQTQLDSEVLERLTEPLLHILRNAVDHGIEAPEERLLLGKDEEGLIRLQVRRDGSAVQVLCADDGRGIDLAAVHARALQLGLVAPGPEPDPAEVMRLILLPGFSTRDQVTEVSGRGVGLDVVSERVRGMKGRVDIDSRELEGTTLSLRLPASGSALHALVVQAGGERVALPTDQVLSALATGQGLIDGGRLLHDGDRYEVASLARWLGLSEAPADAGSGPMVLVRGRGGVVALQVESVIEAQEVILQETGELLARVPGISGGALRSDGRVMFVLDTEALHAAASAMPAEAMRQLRDRARQRRRRILVVDDAISVRKALVQLLEDAGFEALAARDGLEALRRLQTETVDVVLTDLEMPNLNGLDLTTQLRRMEQAAGRAELPVVMITSRSTDKHRKAAQEAGVTQYLTKPYTDADLLGRVRQLLA